MNNNVRRFVAFGYLPADYYYVYNNRPDHNSKYRLIKVDGGASRYNVLVNLAARGCNTKAIPIVHEDEVGNMILKFMKREGVDISDVLKSKYNETKIYHIYPNLSKERGKVSTQFCPLCDTESWIGKDEKFASSKIMNLLRPDDVLILDGIRQNTTNFIKNCRNDKVLDIGRIKRLEEINNNSLLHILKKRIEVIQINESVEKYLFSRFRISKNPINLFHLMNTGLLIITRGEKGADFIFGDDEFTTKKLIKPTVEIDDTGAGDAFFSVFIEEYYKNNKEISQEFINEAFIKATELTAKVVAHLGARGHLYNGLLL